MSKKKDIIIFNPPSAKPERRQLTRKPKRRPVPKDRQLKRRSSRKEIPPHRQLKRKPLDMDKIREEAARILAPAPQHIPANGPSRLSIMLPAETEFEPGLAIELMTIFYGINAPITFGITASADTIIWYIQAHQRHINAVSSQLSNKYAQAQIEATGVRNAHYFNFPIQLCLPYIYPLKTFDEFSFDPLVSVLAAADQLSFNEAFAYEITLYPLDQQAYSLGAEFFNERLESLAYEDRGARINPLYHKLEETRLKSGRMAIKIKANDAGRAQHILSIIWPALALFAQNGGNALMSAGDHLMVLSPAEMASLWHLPNEQFTTIENMRWVRGVQLPLPRELRQQGKGVVLGIHRFRGKEQEVKISYPDRNSHIGIVGRTRVGKSTLQLNMARQDIEAGYAIGIIDPHGDLAQDIIPYIPEKKRKKLIFFNISNTEYPIGLNLLNNSRVPPETIANQFLAVIKKLNEKDWLPGQMEQDLYTCLRVLAEWPQSTLLDVYRIFEDEAFRTKTFAQITDPFLKPHLQSLYTASDADRRKRRQAIHNRIGKFFRNRAVGRIICQDSNLDFRQMMDDEICFIAKIRSEAFSEDFDINTLGTLLIAKFTMAAMSRIDILEKSQRKEYFLYIDEAQNFIHTHLDKVLSEAGKNNLSLTLANQHLSQLEGKTLKALTGNVGASFIFPTNPDDAKHYMNYVGSHFSVDQLVKLDKFTAVASMMHDYKTADPFLVHTNDVPKLKEMSEAEKGQIIQEAVDRSHRTYGTHKDEIDAALKFPALPTALQPAKANKTQPDQINTDQSEPSSSEDNKPKYFGLKNDQPKP